MKKYVKSGYDDYDPDGPLSWEEFTTLQEISELEDDIESNMSEDLFNTITDKCEVLCDELGLDFYKTRLLYEINKFCDELASKIYDEYINK